ncbi:hypothetical protein Pcinc_038134 [Petrolisthes cinctipes]|uniref:Uncharacterized protein n=1 Tax=Petrolisthes cinctipes TaxID=88211 RepID=A0AAE1BRC3_PETCI|nr:hypothetical protein Pcinc_038134 [Petrolisthes cinctipes]
MGYVESHRLGWCGVGRGRHWGNLSGWRGALPEPDLRVVAARSTALSTITCSTTNTSSTSTCTTTTHYYLYYVSNHLSSSHTVSVTLRVNCK